MNIFAKQILVILFLSILITNDVSAVLSEEQKAVFSVEQLRALMIKIAPVTLTALICGIILGLVVRSKNKTIAEQNKTIENQNGTMSKIEQLKTLSQNFLGKTVDDCNDEYGLNVDTAFTYINNNRLFLNIVFSVLNIEDKTFLTNFQQLMAAVEGEYMQKSASYECLKRAKERLEKKNQLLHQERQENKLEIFNLKSKAREDKHEMYELKCAQDAFIDFIISKENVRFLFENFVTGSPLTPDRRLILSSKKFQKYNEPLQ